MERASYVDAQQIDTLLYPLLRADDRPLLAEMVAAARPFLEGGLDHKREEPYLAALAAGRYQPELLFPQHTEIAERIKLHPAVLWKAQNVAEHLARSKRSS